jgi:hypothetical protein
MKRIGPPGNRLSLEICLYLFWTLCEELKLLSPSEHARFLEILSGSPGGKPLANAFHSYIRKSDGT